MSTVTTACRLASVKLCGVPEPPQVPSVVVTVVPTVKEAITPSAWAGTIVTAVAARVPADRVPRAFTRLPTQRLAKLAVGGVKAASVKVVVVATSTVTMLRRPAVIVKVPEASAVPQVPASELPFTEATIPCGPLGWRGEIRFADAAPATTTDPARRTTTAAGRIIPRCGPLSLLNMCGPPFRERAKTPSLKEVYRHVEEVGLARPAVSVPNSQA
jgi:hypothetical protein